MNGKKKILIVEDHLPLRTALEISLQKRGYQTVSAGDGETALQLASEQRPDLLLLDIMLPRKSGFEICQHLRRRNVSLPIIVLTAKTADEDELLSFQLGADDFVRKPFNIETLLARIESLLLRSTLHGETPHISFGQFTLDVAAKTLQNNGQPVELTPREYRLLEYLVINSGRVFSRDQLLDQVWGADFEGTDRTVDRFVTVLRQKIEANPHNPVHLLTVRTYGYKFER
jgi:DNA-binding response OmpR family regulator